MKTPPPWHENIPDVKDIRKGTVVIDDVEYDVFSWETPDWVGGGDATKVTLNDGLKAINPNLVVHVPGRPLKRT